jgi:hypothetical protein
MADRRTVAEGAHHRAGASPLADERGIDMPIVAAVATRCSRQVGRTSCSTTLLSRPPATRKTRNREIDRDALLLPVAVAGRVEPLLLAGRRRVGDGASGSGTGGDGLR